MLKLGGFACNCFRPADFCRSNAIFFSHYYLRLGSLNVQLQLADCVSSQQINCSATAACPDHLANYKIHTPTLNVSLTSPHFYHINPRRLFVHIIRSYLHCLWRQKVGGNGIYRNLSSYTNVSQWINKTKGTHYRIASLASSLVSIAVQLFSLCKRRFSGCKCITTTTFSCTSPPTTTT